MRRVLLLLAISLTAVAQTPVSDWPQFLGPNRDGSYRGPALLETWPAGGPRVVWKKQVGQGFSGSVIAQGRLILFHRVGNNEVVESLDARTGASQWQYSYPTSYRDDFGFDEGPRSVPVIADGVVYTFGAECHLACRRQTHLERRHHEAIRRRQRFFRRRRFSAR
jgi:outer membrane protein assembly factor BamB